MGAQQPGQMAQLAGQFGQMGMSGGVDLRVRQTFQTRPIPVSS